MSRRGMTLVELLVTIAIMGVVLGVTTMAVRRIDAPRPDDPSQVVADSLRAAVARGYGATIRMIIRGRPASAWVNVDGSVIADSAFGVERLTARGGNAR